MMAFLAFGIAGPLFGIMADRVSLAAAMTTAGAISILGAFFYLPGTPRREGSQPPPSRR